MCIPLCILVVFVHSLVLGLNRPGRLIAIVVMFIVALCLIKGLGLNRKLRQLHLFNLFYNIVYTLLYI